HQVAAIAPAVPLDAADLVEEGRQDPGIGVAHAGEGVGPMRLHVGLDQRLTFLLRPLMQTGRGIVDVAVVEPAVIRIVHHLADGRAGAFRLLAVDHAFAFRDPGSGETHGSDSLLLDCRYSTATE